MTAIESVSGCYTCGNSLNIIHASDIVREVGRNLCLVSSSPVVPICPREHNHCPHDVSDGIAQLPECGASAFPLCGSTMSHRSLANAGYLQEVAGWISREATGTPRQDPLSYRQPGGGVMAKKKAKKCSFLKEQRSGKWAVLTCTLPDWGKCPAGATCKQSTQYVDNEPLQEGTG